VSTQVESAMPDLEPTGLAAIPFRIRENVKSGNLGSWPVVVVLAIIVIYFGLTASNFFSAVNFNNIIVQMAGTTMLAYGVVFVLLIGEIDLSIGFVSGVAGVIVAELQLPGSGHDIPDVVGIPGGLIAILIAVGVCSLIGLFQGSIVALIGVPAFVVTLAGLEIWQGVIQKALPEQVIVIQDNTINNVAGYFFSDVWGWALAIVGTLLYAGIVVNGLISNRRHGVAVRDPLLVVLKLVGVAVLAFGAVAICNKDRGVPFALVLVVIMLVVLTFLAKRTTFGRHVYAVGGNAEAARRAGINVARVRMIVFMISSGMAGLGGVMLASRLQSVNIAAGSGTLLIDAISAAVIGGTSLFGGRGEVRNALFGAMVVATIANGLNTQNRSAGDIYVATGVILLLAVIADTVLKRRQTKAGR
jgi:D-xylose transport system permease protein